MYDDGRRPIAIGKGHLSDSSDLKLETYQIARRDYIRITVNMYFILFKMGNAQEYNHVYDP